VAGAFYPADAHELFELVGRLLAEARMSFLVGQAIGRKFSALIGFGSEADAAVATKAIKAAARKRGRERRR
jgi:hypothetical protein